MRRSDFCVTLAGFCLVFTASASPSAKATHPILFYEYSLDVEQSSLTVTGGFAGVHQVYQLGGTLGLVVDSRPHIPDEREAYLSVVDVTLAGDGFFDGHSLDELLNATTWHGLIADEDSLAFGGHDSQQADLLAAAEYDPDHLHLRGENFPSCCDFFNYQWDINARRGESLILAAADIDADGNVDGHDLLDMLLGFGTEGASHSDGDASFDGRVDRIDLNFWRASIADDDTGGPLAPGGVPEPSSILLATLLVALLPLTRRALKVSRV